MFIWFYKKIEVIAEKSSNVRLGELAGAHGGDR
jgi:hypothetical protein